MNTHDPAPSVKELFFLSILPVMAILLAWQDMANPVEDEPERQQKPSSLLARLSMVALMLPFAVLLTPLFILFGLCRATRLI